MKPVKFKGYNCIYAKDQPEYEPLPALRFGDGEILTCWKLSMLELFKLFFTGKIYLSILTFNTPLQPVKLQIDRPKWLEAYAKEFCQEGE